MVLYNWSTKELTAKIVYYGPGLGGKTTNLQWIHDKAPIKNKGKMLSLNTEADRTLFFDFLPIELGLIRGNKTRIQLYTVPGQVFYNATRRMVLKGADAVVFVCDSQEAMLDANLESQENMRQNLQANEIDPNELPVVYQYNKRDLPNALPLEILNERLNPANSPFYEAVATTGVGVEDTLKAVTMLVFRALAEKYGDSETAAPAAQPVPRAPINTLPPRYNTPQPVSQPPSPAFAPPAPAAPPRPRPNTPISTIPPSPAAAMPSDAMLDALELDEEPLDIEVDVLPSEEPALRADLPRRMDAMTTLASTAEEAVAIREFLKAPQSPLDKTPLPVRATPAPVVVPPPPAASQPPALEVDDESDLMDAGAIMSSAVTVELTERSGEHEVVIPVDVVLPKGAVQINLHLRLNLNLRTTK